MEGNLHVRFLGGKDAARRLPYPVSSVNNMNYKDILKNAQPVPFDDFTSYLELFITKCVVKDRRKRWRNFAGSIDDLSLKFNSLWNGIASTKAEKSSTVSAISNKYYYLKLEGIEDSGYVLKSNEAVVIGESMKDGILFAKDKSQAIFLTHEGENYHFKL